jgi:DeoR/GlpR family transcriptional regulator of sugar metabolism
MMPTDTCLQCAQEMPAISTKIITNTVTVFQALWKAVGW